MSTKLTKTHNRNRPTWQSFYFVHVEQGKVNIQTLQYSSTLEPHFQYNNRSRPEEPPPRFLHPMAASSRARSDLTSYAIALSKEIKKDPNHSRIESILQNIATIPEAALTLDLLKTTKIGKLINALKKATTDPTVKTLTKQLLKKMKNVAAGQGYVKPTTPRSGWKPVPAGAVSIALPLSTSSRQGVPFPATSFSSTSAPTTAPTPTTIFTTTKTTHLSNNNIPGLRSTGTASRDHVQKKMLTLLQQAAQGEEQSWPDVEALGQVAVRVEDCMNNQSPATIQPREYMMIAKRLLFNLRSNHPLRASLARGLTPPHVIVSLEPTELANDSIRLMRQDAKEYDKGHRRSNWKQFTAKERAIEAGVKNPGVSMYSCYRCKSRNISSFSMQTRCADEPMTIFCTCLDCGKAFRR